MRLIATIDAQGWVLIIGAIAAGISTVFTVITRELAKLRQHTDSRVDQMWQFFIRRGRVEAESKNLLINNGGDMVTLQPEIRAAYDPIAPTLRDIRRGMPRGYTNGQLAEAINSYRFLGEHGGNLGDWLLRHICHPLNVSEGACIDMAILVAEEKSPRPGSDGNPNDSRLLVKG